MVAIENGAEVLYASLYWWARFGINDLARVHCITPRCERFGTVRQASPFTPSDLTFKRGAGANTDFAPWLPSYPGEGTTLRTAQEGEELPVAKIPEGTGFKIGQESSYAGRAEFYVLRYGPYLIAMNTTRDKTFPLQVLAGGAQSQQARELVSGKQMKLNGTLQVGPMSTVVFALKP